MVVAAILSVAEALMSDFDPQRMILSSVRITAPDPTMLPPQSFGGPEERQQQRGVKDAVRVSRIARETSTRHPTPASNPVKGNQTGMHLADSCTQSSEGQRAPFPMHSSHVN
jgi:hypothetical protein